VSDWNESNASSFSFIKNKPTQLSQFTDNIGVGSHIANKSNPHSVTKAQVGLGNVDNTSDLLKPISNAVQNALNLKANLASPTFTGNVTAPKIFINKAGNAASGISWYNSTYTAWQDYMANSGTTGNGVHANITAPSGTLVTTWARRSFIEGIAGYGWTFESGTNSSTTPSVVAEIRASDGAAKFGGNVTAPTFIGALSGNASTATKLQNARTIWGQSFNGTGNISGAITGATTGNFSGTVTAPTFSGALAGNATTSTTATYLTRAGTSITTAPATHGLRFDTQVSSSTTGIFPTSNNSNAVITLNRHSGNYDSQLGFSSNGDIYYRAFSNVALNTTQA
jgi:hypothetical protein